MTERRSQLKVRAHVLLDAGVIHVWNGNGLLNTAARSSAGEVRKKCASAPRGED